MENVQLDTFFYAHGCVVGRCMAQVCFSTNSRSLGMVASEAASCVPVIVFILLVATGFSLFTGAHATGLDIVDRTCELELRETVEPDKLLDWCQWSVPFVLVTGCVAGFCRDLIVCPKSLLSELKREATPSSASFFAH